MQIHFYTMFDNLEKFKTSEPVQVWSKEQAEPSDVHISIDPDHYHIKQIDEQTFTVSKMTWKDKRDS